MCEISKLGNKYSILNYYNGKKIWNRKKYIKNPKYGIKDVVIVNKHNL